MSSSTPKKIGENQYQIDADSNLGMKVPVRIYADEPLLQKMLSDRTIKQAQNVSSIPGIVVDIDISKIFFHQLHYLDLLLVLQVIDSLFV